MKTISQGRCRECVYCDIDYKWDIGPIWNPFKRPTATELYHCIKFEMRLNGTEADRCTSFLSPQEYKERALSGTLDTRIAKCEYCGKKYNRSEHTSCPRCGA